MDWKRFTKELPEDNQIILQWDRQEAYIGDKKVMSKMEDVPFVTRFNRTEWEEQSGEGKKPDLSNGGIDMYSFMVCWLPLPTLPFEYRKGDFIMNYISDN